MRIDVVTIFPDILRGPLAESLLGRAIERGLVENACEVVSGLAVQQRAADCRQGIDSAPRRGIEGDVQGHRQRRSFRQRAGGVVEQQFLRGPMAAHDLSSFSRASRSRPRARRIRDFTVPNGSRSSSAIAVCVLSSKNAMRITVSWSADRSLNSSCTRVYVCPARTDLSASSASGANTVSQSSVSMAGRADRRDQSAEDELTADPDARGEDVEAESDALEGDGQHQRRRSSSTFDALTLRSSAKTLRTNSSVSRRKSRRNGSVKLGNKTGSGIT